MPDALTSHPILLWLETLTLPLSSTAHTTCVPRYSSGLRAYGLRPVAASGPTNQAQQEKGKPSQPPSSPACPQNKQAARSEGLARLSRSLLPNAGPEEQRCWVLLPAVPRLVWPAPPPHTEVTSTAEQPKRLQWNMNQNPSGTAAQGNRTRQFSESE